MTDLQILYDATGRVTSITELDGGSDKSWDIPALSPVMREGLVRNGFWSGEREFRRDGKPHDYRSRIVPDDEGFLELALQLERHDLSPAAIQNKQLMALTGQLTLGILHKTGNNLTPIASYASLAESSLDTDDPVQKYLESITRNTASCISISRRMVRFFFNANTTRTTCDLDVFLPDMLLLSGFGLGPHVMLHLAAVPGLVVPLAPTEVFQIIGGIVLMTGGKMKTRAQLEVGVFPYSGDMVEITIDCPVEDACTDETKNLSLLRQVLLHTIDLDLEIGLIRAQVERSGGTFGRDRGDLRDRYRITLPASYRELPDAPRVLLAAPGMETHLSFTETGHPLTLYRATDAESIALLLECTRNFDAFVFDAGLHSDTLLETIRLHSPRAHVVFLHEPDSLLIRRENLPGTVVSYPVDADRIRREIAPLLHAAKAPQEKA